MHLPRSIAETIDRVARKSVGKDWQLYATLINRWPDIVGDEYAAATAPAKMLFPHQPLEPRRCNGTLTIAIPKGLMMEFTFKIETIKQRINTYFGYPVIGRIVLEAALSNVLKKPSKRPELKVSPEGLQHIESETSGIESDELRDALRQYGGAVMAQDDRKS